MDTGTVVILVLQVVLGVGLVPIGGWVFTANARLKTIERAVVEMAKRLDSANGDGPGIPTICTKHTDSLNRIEGQLKKLGSWSLRTEERGRNG